MLRLAVVVVLAGLGGSAQAADSVTVEQLRQFLTAKQTAKLRDAEVAGRLSSVSLSEQLTETTRKAILLRVKLGPKAATQLDLLAEASVFQPPPSAEISTEPGPNTAAQHEVVEKARTYVEVALHQLPDFLAVRETAGFNDHPETDDAKPMLRFTGETHREIAFRDGHEVQVGAADGSSASEPAVAGLTTWGEFGPILHVVFEDSPDQGFVWNRWQTMGSGLRVAVFRFAVSEALSHYSIAMCCSRAVQADAAAQLYQLKPGYHGELYVDPETGVVERVTLEADLQPGRELRSSEIAVEYGAVDIGGRRSICPIRGVAISVVHDTQMEAEGGPGELRFMNEVRFLNYHKFGSTARILTSGAGQEH